MGSTDFKDNNNISYLIVFIYSNAEFLMSV